MGGWTRARGATFNLRVDLALAASDYRLKDLGDLSVPPVFDLELSPRIHKLQWTEKRSTAVLIFFCTVKFIGREK